jgi:hypothetical protein
MASILKQNAKFLIKAGFDLTRMEQQVVELLAKHQELSVHAFKKLLPDISADKYFTYTLRYLEFKGVLVRTNHRAIMDRGIKYALMTARFPEVLNSPLTPEAALNLLVLRYITKFGPIGFDDLCWWLSISRTTARKVLTDLAAQLVTLDWEPQEYFMEKNDYQQFHDFKPPAPPTAVINFLPYEDAFPKAFLHRDWFLPEAVAPLVYKAGAINLGQIFPSIWLNGSIIGGWTMNWVDAAHAAMRVEITGLHEREKLNPTVRLQIENQRARLEKFLNEKMLPNLK